MQIGAVLRKYRKEKNLTQAEMAKRLGVSAPAVNKWENGNSLPDVALLSPIARLLGISVDTLLSHEKELSDMDAIKLVEEADERLKTERFDDAFGWIKQRLEEYPNCLNLIIWMARTLDGRRLMLGVTEHNECDAFVVDCYTRVLEDGDAKERLAAATSLYNFYMRKEDYDQAETLLNCFPQESPERKGMQAALYAQTGRQEEASRMYEELLCAEYGSMIASFTSLQHLAMRQGDLARAHLFVDKIRGLAHLFEFGEYHEISPGLELAVLEQDQDETLRIVERLLDNTESIVAFAKSPLFSHMEFAAQDGSFLDEMKESLLQGFQDEEEFGFLKENQRWKDLVGSPHTL